jgi:hypothetical protein
MWHPYYNKSCDIGLFVSRWFQAIFINKKNKKSWMQTVVLHEALIMIIICPSNFGFLLGHNEIMRYQNKTWLPQLKKTYNQSWQEIWQHWSDSYSFQKLFVQSNLVQIKWNIFFSLQEMPSEAVFGFIIWNI